MEELGDDAHVGVPGVKNRIVAMFHRCILYAAFSSGPQAKRKFEKYREVPLSPERECLAGLHSLLQCVTFPNLS